MGIAAKIGRVLGGKSGQASMEIYADPISVNCRKVLAGLQLMGVDYTLKRVGFFEGEHKNADYVALNPNVTMPTMKDGDFVLWESNTILQYAADKYGKSEFYPTELTKRADVNRWLAWESGQWFPSCYIHLVENCVKPILGASPDPAILDGEAENFHKLAAILDTRLQQSNWLCGNAPTIADIAVASPMHMHGEQKLPLDQHPHLTKWMTERVEKLPSWRNTHVGPGFTLPDAA